MKVRYHLVLSTALLAISFINHGCEGKKNTIGDIIARSPGEVQSKSTRLIRQWVRQNDTTVLGDSTPLFQPAILRHLYKGNNFKPIWSLNGQWSTIGQSMINFVQQARLHGLFPQKLHEEKINAIVDGFTADSLGKTNRKNVFLWTKADIMLTDAFIRSVGDIKYGRLPNDSVSLRKDSVLTEEFCLEQLEKLRQTRSMDEVVKNLEPKHPGYISLKKGVKKFLDNAAFKKYTHVPAMPNNPVVFKKALQKRLYEEGFVTTDSIILDSVQMAEGIKRFQRSKGIAIDGRAGEATIRMLNMDDEEKFIRVAISMDQYKMLPDTMPSKYIWVNIPSYFMQVVHNDSVVLNSKVVVGKSKTRTPVLTSKISELIIYPKWVPPSSIVEKEILPAVRRNPGYLARRGFKLINSKGKIVNPYSVNWARHSKAIPYRIVQGSGDANALGVMKFIFDNKYSVYLHDTNQRYLFGQQHRALSHGCVRVQDWDKLAYYLLRLDSLAGGGKHKSDSVKSWLAQKKNKSIPLKEKIPVFIRYITCEGKNGGIVFYDDIYGDFKRLAEQYYVSKK